MFENLKIKPLYEGFIFLAESRRNPPILRTHHHDELELNLVTQGSLSYIISGRVYTFHQGSLLWLFPKQVHQLVDRTPDASYYVAVFKPSLIRDACHGDQYRTLKRKSVKDGAVLRKTLSPESFLRLRHVMDSLMENSLDPDLLNREAGFGLNSAFQFDHGDPDMLNAGLRYLLIQCWRIYCSEQSMETPPPIHPCVRKALEILSIPSEEHDLGLLSKKCGASMSYLSRLFHRQMGVSLSRYRNSVRLHHFVSECQKKTSKTLSQIAYESGFGSYAQFHKLFYESYQMGPREFLNFTRLPLQASALRSLNVSGFGAKK